jgi:hypothetical protein
MGGFYAPQQPIDDEENGAPNLMIMKLMRHHTTT